MIQLGYVSITELNNIDAISSYACQQGALRIWLKIRGRGGVKAPMECL